MIYLNKKECDKLRKETDLSAFIDNAPIIKILISKIETPIRIFFNINCCEIMFEQYEQTYDYRIAFAKAVFHMYQQSAKNNSPILLEDDFINTTDENLQTILKQILVQDNKIKLEYDNNDTDNIYERFYKANEAILKNATVGISKSLEKISKTFAAFNIPLLTSLTNATRTIVTPHDYSTELTSALPPVVTNIPTYDFSDICPTFSNLPKMKNLGMLPAIQTMPKFDFIQLQSTLVNTTQIQFPELASALSNVPQVVFDIQEILSPMQHLLESVQLVSKSSAQTLQMSLLKMAKTTQALISSIDFSLLIYHKKWNEDRETLLKYGWFYSTVLPDDLVHNIHKNQDNLSNEEVDRIIVAYFRQNKCKALKNVVKTWKKLPYFHCREQIFHESLVNHSRKYFNTSVTLLTLHTEGIIADFVRTTLEKPRYHIKNAIEDIKQKLDENAEVSTYEYEIFNDVIKRIEDAFNENFSHANPDATSNTSRHKIAHGHAYEKEKEVNSLKRFLYLNEIYSLFLLLNNP